MWFFSWRNKSRAGKTHRTSTRTALRVESLESRWVPTGGMFDLTFGSGGLTTTDVGADGTAESPSASAVYSSGTNAGKLVVAGSTYLSSQKTDRDFAVVRYNVDGSLDTTFGSGGKITTSIGQDDISKGVVIQADGKIVVGGTTGGDFVLLRYNANGTLDTSFGGTAKGKIKLSISKSSLDEVRDMVLQPDGKVVLAGITTPSGGTAGLALVRFNTDGTLDKSFSGDGKATMSYSSPVAPALYSKGVDLAIDPNSGKLVVGAQLTDGSVVVSRFQTTGELDASFSNGPLNAAAGIHFAMAIQADSRILVARSHSTGSGSELTLVRLTTNGSLDSTFGLGGVKVTAMASETFVSSILVQNDGRIVVGGVQDTGVDADSGRLFVTRFNADGSLDDGSATDTTLGDAFGTNGMATSTGVVVPWRLGTSLLLDSQGRLIIVGTQWVMDSSNNIVDRQWLLVCIQTQ